MHPKGRHFIPYDEMSTKIIKKIAYKLNKISDKNLKDYVSKSFIKYFKAALPKNKLPSFFLERIPLFGVPNTIALIYFNSHPFEYTDLSLVVGQARLLHIPNHGITIPVIYLMPNSVDDTLEHEKVHICQYLQPESFPLTPAQKTLFLSMNLVDCLNNLKSQGKTIARDFIINAACYKLWIEMEANYVVRKPEAPWEWMMKVYRSAMPIETITAYGHESNWEGKDMKIARSKVDDFCQTMEKEIEWVRDIVQRSGEPSLHSLVLWTHDEYETNQILGPIDEYDLLCESEIPFIGSEEDY